MATVERIGLSDAECYSALGLPEGASQEQVEAAYEQLQRFLRPARIPAPLQEWAKRQKDLIEDAYQTLTEAAPTSSRRSASRGGRGSHRAATPPRRPSRQAPRHRQSSEVTGLARTGSFLRKQAVPLAAGAIAALVVLTLVLAGQQIAQRGTAAQPAAQAAAPASPFVPLDRARVAELRATVDRNPADTDALFELGERHFDAGAWEDAIAWFTRLVALDPSHTHARTDIGTANYNLGRYEDARAAWTEALNLAPNDPQLHYNMGFLNANARPQDLEEAKRHWQVVMTLAPGSQIATTAQRDLEVLQRRQAQPLAPRGNP